MSIRNEARADWLAIAAVVVFIAACSALAWWARLHIVEPELVAAACLADADGQQVAWQCSIRKQLVLGSTRNAFGIAAVIVGVLATVSRWRSVAALAVALGVMGAVFYRYELSGVGLLLGAFVLLRRPPQAVRPDNAGGEHRTQSTP